MFRINCTRLLLTVVSIAGLASCSKDAPKSEARARARAFSEPTIISQGLEIRSSAWANNKDQTLDLGEAISLGHPAPRYTWLDSSCRRGGETFVGRKEFSNLNRIPVYNLIPEALLTKDLSAEASHCRITVKMSDTREQASEFFIDAIVQGDHGDLQLTGEHLKPGSIPRIHSKKMLGIRVAHDGSLASDAELACRDVSFPTTPFNDALELTTFRLDNPSSKTPVNTPLDQREDQLCRVILRDRVAKTPLAITRLFKIRFNRAPLEIVKIDDTHVTTPANMRVGAEYKLASYIVTNAEDQPQRFRFNKYGYRVHMKFNLSDGNAIQEIEGPPWLKFFVNGPAGSQEVGPNAVITLQPGQTATYHLIYKPGGDIKCEHRRVRIRPIDDVYIQYLSPTGDIVDSTQLELPPEATKIQYTPEYKFDEALEYSGPRPCTFNN